jgi:acyl-coenzyme A thioesterase PaaI-like protein
MSVMGQEDPAVTLEMNTTFLRAAQGELHSTAEVIWAGRQVV